MQSVFARWDIPKDLVSNSGSEFKSALFDDFKANIGVRISKHILKQKIPKLSSHAAVKGRDAQTKQSYREFSDSRKRNRQLPNLQPGDWERTNMDSEKQLTTATRVASKDECLR